MSRKQQNPPPPNAQRPPPPPAPPPPPVRSEPLLAVFERFKHLDLTLRDCESADDPIYRMAAELWKAIVTFNVSANVPALPPQ